MLSVSPATLQASVSHAPHAVSPSSECGGIAKLLTAQRLKSGPSPRRRRLESPRIQPVGMATSRIDASQRGL
ncbi:hypothetical protein AAFF_G00199310 [Aldrovandia affinis]|uniref:Uncharacterized protein n=1 Tax=Aldrovandia affinis TaxID=143900 RepID=A0AAD7RIL3_9TELE|nr:hypothetical protein AAFF_G00199310 [Aldrovandia affinis]